ncbi:Transposon Tf2-6 poly [Paramuricea clavata]|uniref:Transposon Tf2-6 poly, partial n=1 Tax=Paramuricea clavata TaxID=317549 RepID=A0A6S7JVV7_PARCT|nr:Transposon Tf2-6 poly [Paramuricea clavata]
MADVLNRASFKREISSQKTKNRTIYNNFERKHTIIAGEHIHTGKECRKCGKSNHFAKVCRGKQQTASKSPYTKQQHKQRQDKEPIHPIHEAESDSDRTEDYLYTVHTPKKSPTVRVTINKHCFNATLDTGASLNVIDRATYEKMDGVKLKRTIQQTIC